jgi:hypothetical protein
MTINANCLDLNVDAFCPRREGTKHWVKKYGTLGWCVERSTQAASWTVKLSVRHGNPSPNVKSLGMIVSSARPISPGVSIRASMSFLPL